MGDDIVNIVGKSNAIHQRTLKRLAHDTVDETVAVVGGDHIHVIAKHGLEMLRALPCKFDNFCAVLHGLDAGKNIGVGFEQFDRQPAARITPGIEVVLVKSLDEFYNLAFEFAPVVEPEKFVRCGCDGHFIFPINPLPGTATRAVDILSPSPATGY